MSISSNHSSDKAISTAEKHTPTAKVINFGPFLEDLERADSDTTGVPPTEKPIEHDPNIVDWDGPDDVENPQNWPLRKKFVSVAIVSFITLLSPLASTFLAPAIQEVMAEFNSDNDQLASFVVTAYLLGYVFGPLVLAPLSELYGRVPVYNVCNLLFLVFNIACALAPNLASLVVFRVLAGFAGSCPLTIGSATIHDMVHHDKIGMALAGWVLGPLFGPTFGPLAGAYLTEVKGWRWLFWLLAIASGFSVFITASFLRESYAPLILDRKTKRLRQERGNPALKSKLDTNQSPSDIFKIAIIRPTRMLLFSPIIFLLSFYVAIIYGYLYIVLTTLPDVFKTQYHFSERGVGWAYMGFNVGNVVALIIVGGTSDRLVKYLKARNGGQAKPEFRLPPMTVGAIFIPISLFLYGWSVEKELHWIVPMIGTTLFGAGLIIVFMATAIYLLDAYPLHAASATAAGTVVRSVLGALLPLCGRQMYAALGLGWGNSLLAFIAVALAPVPILFFKYGERIRESTRFAKEF